MQIIEDILLASARNTTDQKSFGGATMRRSGPLHQQSPPINYVLPSVQCTRWPQRWCFNGYVARRYHGRGPGLCARGQNSTNDNNDVSIRNVFLCEHRCETTTKRIISIRSTRLRTFEREDLDNIMMILSREATGNVVVQPRDERNSCADMWRGWKKKPSWSGRKSKKK